MGCDSSRSVQVEENNRRNTKDSGKGGEGVEVGGDGKQAITIHFSDIQIDIIRSTWPLLAKDMAASGMKMFSYIFEVAPSVKALFSYRDLEGEELLCDEGFRRQSVKYMQTVGTVVENIEQLDHEASHLLMMLGAKHATYRDFDVHYFTIYTKSMLQTWEWFIGEEFTQEVRAVWTLLFEFIGNKVRDGYYLYLKSEHEDLEEQISPQKDP